MRRAPCGSRAARRGWPLAVALACACRARSGDLARVDGEAAALDASDTCGVLTGYELTLSGLGVMRVGRLAADIRRVCRVVADDTTDVGTEDYPSRVLTVWTPRGNANVLVDSGRVSSVSVAVPTLRTSDSLGVGTTLGRLLQIDGTVGGEDDWGIVVAPGGRCGLNFSLAYGVSTPRIGHAWTAEDLAQLPSGLRVRKVYATATDCPGASVDADTSADADTTADDPAQ